MSKIIVDFDSKSGDINDCSSTKLNGLHNHFLIITVDTTEKDVYHGEGKSITRKVLTSYVTSSSSLF